MPTPWSGTCARCSTRTRRISTPSQVGVTASRMPTLRTRAQDRRPDGRADHQRAGRLPADQPDQPVHGLAGALGAKLDGGAGRRHRPGRARQAGLDRLRRRRLRHRPVQGDALRAARAARAGAPTRPTGTPKRTPKIDRVVLLPMPEANARTAALLSGQVDWIEAPSPDAVPQITQRGFKIYSNAAAARLAVAALVRRGLALARQARAPGRQPLRRPRRAEAAARRHDGRPKGTVPPGHPWWGNPTFDIKYDVDGGQEADDRGRLLGRQAAQGEGADLGLGLGPDAAAADERVRAAEPEGVLLRRRVRRDRVEHAVHQLAQGREGPVAPTAPTRSTSASRRWTRSSRWSASSAPRPSRRCPTTGATSATPRSTS